MCAGRLEWMGFRENGAGGREDCVSYKRRVGAVRLCRTMEATGRMLFFSLTTVGRY